MIINRLHHGVNIIEKIYFIPFWFKSPKSRQKLNRIA